MPAKSRRKRGKTLPPSKKNKVRASTPTVVMQEQVTTRAPEPVSHPEAPASPERKPAQTARPEIARYPHIAAELWNIGILAVIMLAILAVLASVLS